MLEKISNEGLKSIQGLVKAYLDAQKEVDTATEILSKKTAFLNEIQNKLLPEAMKELNIPDFTYDDGKTSAKITIQNGLNASINKDAKEVVYNWLKQIGEDAIVKSEVSVSFGKTEGQNAEQLVEKLQGIGLPATLTRNIHHLTLNSFVKNMREEGKEIHPSINVFDYSQAVVKVTT